MPDPSRQSPNPPTPPNPPAPPEGEDNPFAAPPEGRPDQPWEPRRDKWSSEQPQRGDGPFGDRPREGRSGGPGGSGGQGPGGLRWDPTDPVQRRARYALLGGMWAFFFALFDLPALGLLLGALSLYWGSSALRGKPKVARSADLAPAAGSGSGPGSPAPPGATPPRPQVTAAVSGLVMASLALLVVAASYATQIVYRDFYTCTADALTKTAELQCNQELPEPLRDLIGVKE
ncbi:hypothetical protein [Streptomyces sp. NPDC006879]|uniref:hypothetical protein n=1 Tax=Streptomyces sp. NPDC006879 TaxID=3364767 RepID=UPI0036D0DCEF